MSAGIFPPSLNTKAQGRAAGRVPSGDPAHARFNDCSHLTCKDTDSQRQSEVPETPQSLAKTLALEHVPVFGGWDRGEVRTHHMSKGNSILLVGLFLKKTKKTKKTTDLIYFLKYS